MCLFQGCYWIIELQHDFGIVCELWLLMVKCGTEGFQIRKERLSVRMSLMIFSGTSFWIHSFRKWANDSISSLISGSLRHVLLSRASIWMSAARHLQPWKRWTVSPTSHCPRLTGRWKCRTPARRMKAKMAAFIPNPTRPAKPCLTTARRSASTTTATTDRRPSARNRKVKQLILLHVWVFFFSIHHSEYCLFLYANLAKNEKT